MTYNLHPIFVHFPIAMLFVYALIKILPFRKWFPAVGWRDIERVLLFVGVLGCIAALSTGDTAKQLAQPNHDLVDAHETFGTISTWIFSALLLGEIAAMINAKNYFQNYKWISEIFYLIEKILCNKIFTIILAIIGLVTITVTGMLGGVITHGLEIDPVAPFILKILGINLG